MAKASQLRDLIGQKIFHNSFFNYALFVEVLIIYVTAPCLFLFIYKERAVKNVFAGENQYADGSYLNILRDVQYIISY